MKLNTLFENYNPLLDFRNMGLQLHNAGSWSMPITQRNARIYVIPDLVKKFDRWDNVDRAYEEVRDIIVRDARIYINLSRNEWDLFNIQHTDVVNAGAFHDDDEFTDSVNYVMIMVSETSESISVPNTTLKPEWTAYLRKVLADTKKNLIQALDEYIRDRDVLKRSPL